MTDSASVHPDSSVVFEKLEQLVKRSPSGLSINDIKAILSEEYGINGASQVNFIYGIPNVTRSNRSRFVHKDNLVVTRTALSQPAARTRGAMSEIEAHLERSARVCTYAELEGIFVDERNFTADDVAGITKSQRVAKYTPNSVVHMNTLEWTDQKQDALESCAFDYHCRCEQDGRPYACISALLETGDLPDLPAELRWTATLLEDLLGRTGRFITRRASGDTYFKPSDSRRSDCHLAREVRGKNDQLKEDEGAKLDARVPREPVPGAELGESILNRPIGTVGPDSEHFVSVRVADMGLSNEDIDCLREVAVFPEDSLCSASHVTLGMLLAAGISDAGLRSVYLNSPDTLVLGVSDEQIVKDSDIQGMERWDLRAIGMPEDEAAAMRCCGVCDLEDASKCTERSVIKRCGLTVAALRCISLLWQLKVHVDRVRELQSAWRRMQ